MNIQTDRLTLSLMDESCRDDFFRLYQCPKIMRHIGEPCSGEYLSRAFRNALKWNVHASLNQKVWQIAEKNTSDFVGIVSAKNVSQPFDAHEVGIMLRRSKFMKGFSVEALGGLINFLSREQGVSNFVGRVRKGNIPAAKMLLNLKFDELKEHNGYRLFSLTNDELCYPE